MSIFNNSIWPNIDGQLGETKVAIPDGVTTTWPEGNVLVGDFVFNNNGDLIGLVDTKALIANSSGSTTFPYDYVEINLPSIAEGEMIYNYDQCDYFILNGKVIKGDISSDEELEIITKKYLGCKTVADIKAVDPNYLTNDIIDGVWSEGLGDLEQGGNGSWNGGMFYNCTALTSFISDLSSMTNGAYMFYRCTQVTTFSSDLSSLTSGSSMFSGCSNLTSFNSDLSSLTDGNNMFGSCNLTSFNSDLSSLTDGNNMFYGCKLTSFSSDLSSLTNGSNMFRYCMNLESFSSDLSSLQSGGGMFSGCSKLASFSSDLSSLSYGGSMFEYCDKLTSFSSNLHSLTDGNGMFIGCKLNTASVQNIADTINTSSNKKLDIGIGNFTPNEQEVAAFNQMVSKGWIVFVNSNYYGGDEGGYYGYTASASLASSAMTLDEIGESEMFNPKPYWAKPINSDEQNARYVDSEGNYYNILGAQFIYGDDLSTYGMFTSLEDAATQMRLTKFTKGEEPVIIETA